MNTQAADQLAKDAAGPAPERGSRPGTSEQRRRILTSGAAAGVLTALAAASFAARAGDSGQKEDHDEARRALLAGEVRPLRQVLDDVARDFPGEPVKIEFERDDGVYIYEIKLLQPSGSIVKLKIDARTGAVLKLKGRNVERRTD